MALSSRAAGVAVLLGLSSSAFAQSSPWFGGIGLSNERVERGVSQSDRKGSLDAHLGLRHTSGLYGLLGVATVSDTQYVGSDGYKLMPEVGFNRTLGEGGDWRWSSRLRAQVFPGARSPWFGSLPRLLQGRVLQAQTSDYGTAELGASLSYKVATLSVTRSLTDYLGLRATETSAAGSRVIDSQGTTYVALDIDWPATEQLSLNVGVGRLLVPNFESLDYSDWRVGAAYRLQRWPGWQLGVQAGGSDARSWSERLRNRGGGVSSSSAGTVVTASLGWSF